LGYPKALLKILELVMYQVNRQFFYGSRSVLMTMLMGLAGVVTLQTPVPAQTILQEQGTLAPMRDEYRFEGAAGQSVTIELKSAEFDTVVYLLDADGNELEMNDDYGGTLNSTIVATLPESGKYTVVASSFSGQGGTYDLQIRPANEYELVYDRAIELMTSEDYSEAIEAYTAAISLNQSDPNAYLGRADAYWGEAYLELGETFQGPASLSTSTREAILADYEKAADIFDTQGNAELANSIREQAQYVRTGVTPDTGR
jgi:tetratricopeptide (TPR) repeat protein